MAEALERLIRLGFEAAGLEAVVACVDPPNVASIRVLELAGLRRERALTWRGIPLLRYRLARAEWRAPAAGSA